MGDFGLIQGLINALSPINLLMAALGAFIGTAVGVLPGLGPTSAIAILLPLTAVLEPTQAVIMMAGIFYGAMYGGSTTAILLNIPGEVASVPTCLDGYPLAQQGKGGPALGMVAISSFVAGTIGVIGLSFFAPLLADQALKFGPPEYVGLMLLALTVIVNLCGSSVIKGLLMAFFGYLLSLVGIGISSGMPRLTFGSTTLMGGLEVISMVIGLFAITEVLKGVEEEKVAISVDKIGRVFPSWIDIKENFTAMLRGSLLGFFMGLLPGCAPAVTTFLAYDLEKKVSKTPEKFGHGAMQGVVSPEAANNSTSTAGFIPLFSLGIPASPPLAVLLGGLMIYGLAPGPMLFLNQPEFVWTVIASMYIGNIMLIILNLPLVGIWVKLTKIPYGILAPIILIVCIIGSYTVRNSMFDVFMSILFGIVGYVCYKFRWPTVPFVICFILGPTLEKSLIQTLAMSKGNLTIFLHRPIALTLLILCAILLYVSLRLKKRTELRVTQEVGESVNIAE